MENCCIIASGNKEDLYEISWNTDSDRRFPGIRKVRNVSPGYAGRENPDPEAKEWVTTELIRNKDAGAYEKYDEKLDPETIVGIKVSANYDNSRRYGVFLNYYVWDYTSGAANAVEIESQRKTVNFNSDGSIDSVYYWFDYGTEDGVDDTADGKLRRGHSYVFSFVGGLDLNKDGEAETRYPASESIILKSEENKIYKQEPNILMYPSTSDSSSFTIKYTLKDLDSALSDGAFTAVLSDASGKQLGSNSQDVVETNTYVPLTFSNFGHNEGYLSINANVESIKGATPIKKYLH